MTHLQDSAILEKIQKRSESESLIVLRRSPFSEIPLIVFSMLLIYLSFKATQYFPVLTHHVNFSGYSLNIPFPAFLPIAFLAVLFHRLYDSQYYIADSYVVAITGIISLKKHELRFDYENIRGIEIDQSLYQRILNLGDIQIGSSMHADINMNMDGIYDPSLYQKIIELRIREHLAHVAEKISSHESQSTSDLGTVFDDDLENLPD